MECGVNCAVRVGHSLRTIFPYACGSVSADLFSPAVEGGTAKLQKISVKFSQRGVQRKAFGEGKALLPAGCSHAIDDLKDLQLSYVIYLFVSSDLLNRDF